MYIVRNQANTVILRLAQKQTTTTHDWLFEFRNSVEGPAKYCSAVDISPYPTIYNEFVITDNVNENAANGRLRFKPTGTWDYKVYEMPVASPPALTPTGYLAICGFGTAKIFDSTEGVEVPFIGDNTKNNKTFKG